MTAAQALWMILAGWVLGGIALWLDYRADRR